MTLSTDTETRPYRIRDERRCTATANSTGERCRQPAIRGGTVCRAHGGSAPQVRKKAQMRLADQEARAALQRLDIDPLDDPVTELLKVASETVALKDFLAGRYTQMSAAQEAEAAEAYSRALERASKLLVQINQLGLVERQVRVIEEQAQRFAGALHGVLSELGVEMNEDTMTVVRHHMLSLDSPEDSKEG